MSKQRLGDTLPILTKIENFFFNRREGFRPKIGVWYYPKKRRKLLEFEKVNMPAHAVDRWWRDRRQTIRVMVKYKGYSIPCNFRVIDEKTCKVYIRKPHTRKIVYKMSLPTKDLVFRKKSRLKREGYHRIRIKHNGIVSAKRSTLYKNYVVELKQIDSSEFQKIKKYSY